MRFIRVVALIALILTFAVIGIAQQAPASPVADAQSGPKRPALTEAQQKDLHYALELQRAGKQEEALPWAEKLYKQAPTDYVIVELLADCLVQHSAIIEDTEQKKAALIRARKLYTEGKALGENIISVTMLGLIPEDGSPTEFSKNPEIQNFMKNGEAEWAKGSPEKAREWYLRAVVLDPNNYGAVLFVGDTYFRQGQAVAAGEWFLRATKIEPDNETAYRYWGDSLLGAHKYTEARDRFVDAVIANPYEQRTWNGVNNYLHHTNGKARFYKIKPQGEAKAGDKPGNINVTIDPSTLGKKDSGAAWLAYSLSRAEWLGDKFKKEFPDEKSYRHSLKEEAEALSMAASVAGEIASGKKAEKPNEDLAILVELKQKGFLEPYVLLNTPDAGIVQDYAAYRKAHRDVLERYLKEFVLSAPPPDGKQ